MADLDGNSIKQEGSITTSEGFVLLVWTALLSGGASDTFTVPGATSTAGVGILLKGLGEAVEMPFSTASPTDSRNAPQASITVTIAATSGGASTVTVTNSASPRRRNSVIIVTKHRAGMSNNLAIDESV